MSDRNRLDKLDFRMISFVVDLYNINNELE